MVIVSPLSFHAGNAADRLVGPNCLPPHLTGALNHDFLRKFLPELLQDVDVQIRMHLWFMPDGAPPHFLPTVQEFLNSVFLAQWMGQGGPTAWPAHSPDLNCGGYPQSAVFAAELDDVQNLQQ
jgi:hypothetical protein